VGEGLPRQLSYLVAIGGDATVSAAAAMRLSVPYVPVPSGFGNLFTSMFEHPHDPVETGDGRERAKDAHVSRRWQPWCHRERQN
jgi:diacylglycerol kinase family enzyme